MTSGKRFEEQLAQTIREILELVRPRTEPEYRKYLIWKRRTGDGWAGSWEDRPVPPRCLDEVDWKSRGDNLERAFRSRYPNLPVLVGTPLTGCLRLTADRLLLSIVHELWRRYPDWLISDDALREFLEELDECLEAKEVTFELLAPLVNLDLGEGVDSVDLAGGLTLVRMTEEQVSKIYGGPDYLVEGRRRTSPVPCALVGSFAECVCGSDGLADCNYHKNLQPLLDRIILGMRTFKPAPAALDGVHTRSASYSPLVIGEAILSRSDAFVPSDGCCLSTGECEAFRKHLAMFVGELHPAVEIACSRYGSAVVRRAASDRILDLMIGLEAILLAGAGSAKDRGELRYRLAVRYATLFDRASDRKHDFRIVKDLYNARSEIVHGGGTDRLYKIADERLSPDDVATKAREVLHRVLLAFLGDGPQPRFMRPDFWEDQLFGGG